MIRRTSAVGAAAVGSPTGSRLGSGTGRAATWPPTGRSAGRAGRGGRRVHRLRTPSAHTLTRLAGALAAGLVLDAAFEPIGWWPLAVVAVTAFTLLTASQRWRSGLLIGFCFGLGQFLPLLWWLHVVTPLAWLVLAAVEAVYVAVLGAALTFVVRRLALWPLWVACLWVAEELVRDRWPLGGFTWGRLAFSQGHTAFTGYAALAGAPLVTFAVALTGACLAAVLCTARTWRFAAAVAGVGVLAVPLAGLAIPRPTNGPSVQIAVVQGNVPRPGTHFLGRAQQVLDDHLAETATLVRAVASGRLRQPQLVLWPENASDVDPLRNAAVTAKVQAAVRAVGVPVLVGSVLEADADHASNTAIVWDPTTGPGQQYTKRHLVPFGEYIPWRGLVRHLTSLTSLVPENFVPGHAVGALDVGPTRLADVMCFEVAFDDQVRAGVKAGGQLIVVQTNNATYMHTAETRQQLAMSQLRAVEHGRSVVVAATSGISAVIAPDGRVRARTSELTAALIDVPVATRTQETIADHLGAAPEWALGILGVLAALMGAATNNRRTSQRRRPRKGYAAWPR